jgi:TPR repeat protein
MAKFSKFFVVIFFAASWSVSSAQTVDPEYSEVLRKAQAGIDTGQFNLGLMYFKGEGVDQSLPQAIKWMKLAANQGLPDAQHILSAAYADGLGVEKNLKTAYSWAHKAARQGHGDAQFQIGTMYLNGIGVEKNLAQAEAWYKKSADQENLDAIFNLATLLRDQKKEGQAIHYYTKAAVVGDPEAQMNLAIQYAISKDPLRNDVKAMMWLFIADVNGAKVNNLFDLISEEMTDLELTQAENAAITCYESEYKICL